MSTNELLAQCFLHFFHLDRSNAPIHTAPVRYSPITFRLAEELMRHDHEIIIPPEVLSVIEDRGAYAEDLGR